MELIPPPSTSMILCWLGFWGNYTFIPVACRFLRAEALTGLSRKFLWDHPLSQAVGVPCWGCPTTLIILTSASMSRIFWGNKLHLTLSSHLGLYSLSGKTSYRKISWSLEAARFGFKLFQSLWNFAGTSAALLPRCLSNFRAIRPLQHPILRLRDFTRFGGKTSYRLVNRGPGPHHWVWFRSDPLRSCWTCPTILFGCSLLYACPTAFATFRLLTEDTPGLALRTPGTLKFWTFFHLACLDQWRGRNC